MKKLCELQPGEKCCVVGTLFKAMPLQPSILREVSEEVSTLPWGQWAACLGAGQGGHLGEQAREPWWTLAPTAFTLPSSTTCSPSPPGASTSTQTMSWSWKMSCSESDWKAPSMCPGWSQVGSGAGGL